MQQTTQEAYGQALATAATIAGHMPSPPPPSPQKPARSVVKVDGTPAVLAMPLIALAFVLFGGLLAQLFG